MRIGRPSWIVLWLGLAALLAVLAPAAAAASAGPTITGAVSDPTNLAGTVSVAVSGSYAYTTAYQSGELTAIDFSNPASPQIAGESPPFLDTNLIGGSNVAIAGGYAFVVSKNRNASTSNNDDGNGNSLTILDIHSNPAQPAIVGTVRDTGKLFGGYGVAVSGNYAYVAYQGTLVGQPGSPDTSSGGFSVVDISNLSSPTVVANIDNGSLPTPFTGTNALQHSTSVAISGRYAYVTAFYSDRVTAIDISSPTAPKIVASLHDSTNLGNPADLAVQGSHLYVANQIGGTVPQFSVLDISTPTRPKVVGTLSTASALSGAYRIRVLGKFAYIAASGAKSVAAIDISNPLQPRLAASIQSAADLNRTTGLDVTPDGRYVVASSPYLSTQFNSTYPPYPLQTGGGGGTGTISVIQLDPSPIGVTISPASEPPDPSASTSASFTFSVSDSVSVVQCQLDGGPLGACDSPTAKSYSGLTLGSHTFTVQAADAGGSTSSSSYTWTVGAAPANSGLPAISGSAIQGQTLTADPGTWSGYPAPTYAYQWNQCDPSGANCNIIQGATSQTYTVQPGDVGNALSVSVAATNSLGSAGASSNPTGVVGAGPVNNTAPTIAGTASIGSQLTASPGSWSGSPPPTYGYQWESCDQSGQNCQPLSGATGSTYTVGSGDVATTLEVAVTASNSNGSTTANSTPTAVVNGSPVNKSTPTISGSAVQGHTLTAAPGTWIAYPAPTYTYQWQRCNQTGGSCANIGTATGATYVLQRSDMANTVRVIVTAANGIGTPSGATSGTTTIVTGPPINTVLPAISGTAAQGSTLTGTSGSWTGYPAPSLAFQWKRCGTGDCAAITGATTNTYTVSSADAGFAIRLFIVATNSAGTTVARSNPTGTVAAGTLTAAAIVGIQSHSPKLRVAVSVAAGQAAADRIAIRLPSGMSFARIRNAKHGLLVRDRKGRKLAFSASVHSGLLTFVLRRAATAFTVEIAGPELGVSEALIAGVHRDPKASARLTVMVWNATGLVVHRTQRVRLR